MLSTGQPSLIHSRTHLQPLQWPISTKVVCSSLHPTRMFLFYPVPSPFPVQHQHKFACLLHILQPGGNVHLEFLVPERWPTLHFFWIPANPHISPLFILQIENGPHLLLKWSWNTQKDCTWGEQWKFNKSPEIQPTAPFRYFSCSFHCSVQLHLSMQIIFSCYCQLSRGRFKSGFSYFITSHFLVVKASDILNSIYCKSKKYCQPISLSPLPLKKKGKKKKPCFLKWCPFKQLRLQCP